MHPLVNVPSRHTSRNILSASRALRLCRSRPSRSGSCSVGVVTAAASASASVNNPGTRHCLMRPTHRSAPKLQRISSEPGSPVCRQRSLTASATNHLSARLASGRVDPQSRIGPRLVRLRQISTPCSSLALRAASATCVLWLIVLPQAEVSRMCCANPSSSCSPCTESTAQTPHTCQQSSSAISSPH